MTPSKFATCLSCMDGRVQIPVINWIKEHCGAEYVDMITEAGMDGLLCDGKCEMNGLLYKIGISEEKHGSDTIFIVGHCDCGGNPVDDDTHKKQIRRAVEKIRKLRPSMKACGLWVSDKWEVEEIASV